jgi:hypothetical protein
MAIYSVLSASVLEGNTDFMSKPQLHNAGKMKLVSDHNPANTRRGGGRAVDVLPAKPPCSTCERSNFPNKRELDAEFARQKFWHNRRGK